MASRYRRPRARALKTFFKAHAQLYEASDGRIGRWIGIMALGRSTLLLSVNSRKSGLVRATPSVYFDDGDNYVVVVSAGAAWGAPQW